MSSRLARGVFLFGFWVVLTSGTPADIIAGAAAAAAASWVSLRLLPPTGWHPSPVACARFVARFLSQSVLAGVDVALRALDPRLPIRPGFVTYPMQLEAGVARSVFCTLASLQPGTLPAGIGADGALIVHCLDAGQPVQAQLGREEAMLIGALGCNG